MKKQRIKAGLSAAVVGLLSPLAMIAPASAATVTWTGATDNSMNMAYNWVNGGILVSGDTAVFPASARNQSPENDLSGLSLVKIIFNGEVSGPSSKSYALTGNSLTITEAIEAIMTGSGGDHSVETDVTLTGDATFKTTGSNTLSVGREDKTIALGSNDLTLDASGGTITLMGEVTGSGKIVKLGTSKVKLMTTAGSGYTGSIDVTSGEFSVDKSFGATNVTINGGTLKGTGTVGGVTMTSGAIAPGNSPGVLNTSDLVMTGGSHNVELAGKASGEFDQLNVTGSVNLGSATTLNVSLINNFAPAVNDSFVIINNDGNDAVQGTFSGLADGGKFTLGAHTYQINYDAGDGNDVVLLVTGTPSAPDTGVGSVLSNPITTIVAALLVAGSVVGYRVYEMKKVRR